MSESRRIIKCQKLNEELPGLEKPPFSGEIGQLIFDKISEKAWLSWKDDMQIKVINEYRLNMGDNNDYNKLVEQMMMFLNLQSGEVAEVENEQRGKGE